MNVLISLFISFIAYNYAIEECPNKRQEWNGCASLCGSPSCMDAFYTGQPPIFCPAVCVERCECISGKYILGINGESCIPIANCPKTITCPEGRIYSNNGYPKSCYDRNPTCNETMKGCFCPEGLFEDELGNCIPESYCPLGCGGNEIEDNCASPCQPTCSNPRPGYCIETCERKCVCSPPLVRNDEGRCVNIEECVNDCKIEGMEMHECGNCLLTCENYQFLDCPMECEKGCQCKQGTVLDETRYKCIPQEFCTCPAI